LCAHRCVEFRSLREGDPVIGAEFEGLLETPGGLGEFPHGRKNETALGPGVGMVRMDLGRPFQDRRSGRELIERP
jgi:hypothetical protein